ncbi:MAG: hypothetical protein IGS48_22005 [Oscillatoriales cyanobacterium C42_A2020_001]|nr:hypothetical protein [Leptolyngbyaceae cyanobacterium C42_A2020_001]
MIAGQIWKFRNKLATISDQILAIERAVDRILYPAPAAIRKAQMGTSRLRDRYEQLGIQYARVQQIISILSVGQLFWRYRRLLNPKSSTGQTTPRKR